MLRHDRRCLRASPGRGYYLALGCGVCRQVPSRQCTRHASVGAHCEELAWRMRAGAVRALDGDRTWGRSLRGPYSQSMWSSWRQLLQVSTRLHELDGQWAVGVERSCPLAWSNSIGATVRAVRARSVEPSDRGLCPSHFYMLHEQHN